MTDDLNERMRGLLDRMRVPSALTMPALHSRFGDLSEVEPAPGQVWRVEWDGVARLVLMLSSEDRRWRVAPVSVEPTSEDEHSLVVGSRDNVFAVRVTVWAGLAGSIPTGALSGIVDQWSTEITVWCADAAEGIFHDTPSGSRRGVAGEPWGAADAIRAQLTDDLDALSAAPVVPVQTSEANPLKAAAERVGLRNLITALGLSQPTVMKIVQGRQPPSAEQARILAELLGLDPDEIMAASGLPTDLASELERPRWRETWKSIARHLQIDEAAARLRVGFGTVAMEFRQTGGKTPDWRTRIQQWLTVNAGEAKTPDS